MPEDVHIISGGTHIDERGEVRFINDFDLAEVRRFYQITNSSQYPLRAWQAHKLEKKWFYALRGEFLIGTVKVDDWNTPEMSKQINYVELRSDKPEILHIPGGFANSIRSLKEDSILQVFSNFSVEESKADDMRFPPDFW